MKALPGVFVSNSFPSAGFAPLRTPLVAAFLHAIDRAKRGELAARLLQVKADPGPVARFAGVELDEFLGMARAASKRDVTAFLRLPRNRRGPVAPEAAADTDRHGGMVIRAPDFERVVASLECGLERALIVAFSNRMISRGFSQSAAARLAGVSCPTLCRLRQEAARYGANGLVGKTYKCGRRPKRTAPEGPGNASGEASAVVYQAEPESAAAAASFARQGYSSGGQAPETAE